ncbi:MAG: hypothetical protein KatS3mg091_145 [Patescibacteria group bacterium]|nr:MAG: hypothetical protein KatS3mg091_145 [Patescibacteria group bacterium]
MVSFSNEYLKNGLYAIALALVLFFIVYLHYNLRLSFRFGDEIAHFYAGHLMLKGKKLYTDIQLNHQPIPYLISAVVDMVFPSNTLLRFITLQRLAVLAYSLGFSLILLYMFGRRVLVFILIFEFTKFFLQGYKNLQETFAVYGLIYLVFDLVKLYLENQDSNLRKVLFSFAVFIVLFSLLPAWPALAVLVSLRLIRTKPNKYLLFLPFALLLVCMSFVINYFDWFRETVLYNVKYFIPNSGESVNLIKLFFLPFSAFLPPYNYLKLILGLTVLSLVISFYYLKKHRILLVCLIFCFYLLNPRVDEFDFFNFHLLPYFGFILALDFILSAYRSWIFYLKYFLIILIMSFAFYNNSDLFAKKNYDAEFHINYYISQKYINAVNLVKDDSDKVLVIPNDPLIYYGITTLPAVRVIEYYPWVYYIPEVRAELWQLLKNLPPEIIILTSTHNVDLNNEVGSYLIGLLKDYKRLNTTNEDYEIYLSKDKAETIPYDKVNQLQNFGFQF